MSFFGLVEWLEVRLDDRAVELPADAAAVGEDGWQTPQRWVEQLAQLACLSFGVLFLLGLFWLLIFANGTAGSLLSFFEHRLMSFHSPCDASD